MTEAKTESEATVRLNPGFPVAHLNLGLALVQLGQLDEAQRQFAETLRLEPTTRKRPITWIRPKLRRKLNRELDKSGLDIEQAGTQSTLA